MSFRVSLFSFATVRLDLHKYAMAGSARKFTAHILLKAGLFVLLSLFYTLPTLAQVGSEQINFRHLTTADGLPESTGQALAEDSLGYIWIGTQSGLVRYNGASMFTFKANLSDSTALPSNQVEGLYIDRRNRLWITTRNGLCLYRPESNSFQRIHPPTTCKHESCAWFQPQIYEDESGNIWTFNFRGALKIEPNFNKTYYPFPSSTRQIITVTEINGQLLFSQKNRIYNSAQTLTVADSTPAHITSLSVQNDVLIATTLSGVYEKSGNDWRVIEGTQGVFALGYFVDSENRHWITSAAGLLLYRPSDGRLQQFTHDANQPTSLSQSLALSFLEDQRGWIWVGTGDGVSIYNPHLPRIVHAEFLSNWNLPNDPVEVITVDSHQRLWIAAANQLICITPNSLSPFPYESGTAKVYPSSVFTSGAFNIDILYAEADTLWIGSFDGNLFRFNVETAEVTQYLPPNGLDRLRGICRIPEGLLLGYATGTRIFRNGEIVDAHPELMNPFVVQLIKVNDESVWLGSPERLIHYSADYITRYPANAADSLPNGTMLTAALEEDETTWLATFGTGLLEYHQGRFSAHNQQSGYPDDNVWSVYAHNEYLWSSTDKGIVKYTPETGESALLSQNQGIYSSDFIMSAHAQALDGTLFFGHPEGLVILYPQDFNTTPGAVSISGVEVNYKNAPSTYLDYLNSGIITLHPGESNIVLHLASSSFGDEFNERILWKWNTHEDWIELPEDQHQLSFTNLEPGAQRLFLKTSNGNSTEVRFEVIPPFYKTTWFRLLAFLTALLLTAILVYWYNRWKYTKQIRKLEMERSIQKERERISKDLHDYVGAHLTRISTDLDLHLLQRPELSETDRESLQATRDFTQGTVHLLRDTIWAIDENAFTVTEFANRVENFLESYLGDFVTWKVTSESPVPGQLGPNDALNLLRIVQEATQNMLKYSEAENYTIHLSSTEEHIELLISDDGVGMESTESGEHSFGLDNMVERAEAIHGKCEITSTLGKGVQISVTLSRSRPTVHENVGQST